MNALEWFRKEYFETRADNVDNDPQRKRFCFNGLVDASATLETTVGLGDPREVVTGRLFFGQSESLPLEFANFPFKNVSSVVLDVATAQIPKFALPEDTGRVR